MIRATTFLLIVLLTFSLTSIPYAYACTLAFLPPPWITNIEADCSMTVDLRVMLLYIIGAVVISYALIRETSPKSSWKLAATYSSMVAIGLVEWHLLFFY